MTAQEDPIYLEKKKNGEKKQIKTGLVD